MKRTNQFEVIGPEIATYISDPARKMSRLIVPWRGTRFVVCGRSGSGKTSAIELANELLPADEQIAESLELVFEKDSLKALEILESCELEYEASLHIGFTVCSRQLATALESKGVKVFWLDSGSTA